MSRIGKKPIPVPANTQVTVADGRITVKGAKGRLERQIPPMVDFSIGDDAIEVTIPDENRKTRAMQGLARSLVANMVIGVTEGFERVLEINGIGYRAEVSGQKLTLNLGFSNPINYELPAGISAEMRIPTGEVTAHFVSPAILSLDEAGTLGLKTVGEDGRVAFHPVDVVRAETDGVWLTGLPETARIITRGQGFVRAGDAVDAHPAREAPAQ